MKKLMFIAMTIALFVPINSVAEDEPSWYFSAKLGQTSYEGTSESATGYALELGYNFNENWAIQGGYADFGKASDSEFSDSSAGLNIKGIGYLPLNERYDVFAQLGIGFFKSESETTIETDFRDINISSDDNYTELVFGVGFRYKITPYNSLFLLLDNYDGVNSPSIGMQFNF